MTQQFAVYNAYLSDTGWRDIKVHILLFVFGVDIDSICTFWTAGVILTPEQNIKSRIFH